MVKTFGFYCFFFGLPPFLPPAIFRNVASSVGAICMKERSSKFLSASVSFGYLSKLKKSGYSSVKQKPLKASKSASLALSSNRFAIVLSDA